jgi:PhzF family phenazine biosynthesis protein
MKYFIVDAFTSQPFGGNPAGVVLLDGDSFPKEELMLQVAAELRYSETAFVRRDSDSEYTVHYFTPKAEVELCGHATIAAFSLLYRLRLAKGECICHTLAGDLRIDVGEKVLMQMATPRIVDTISDAEEIYRAIGVTDYQPTLPVQIAYSGLPDIMIPLHNIAMLQSLKPDMEAITEITRKYEAVSFHVFAFAGDGHTAHVRDFAPLYNIPEESATGTANAALTHYLQENGRIPSTGDFSFLQGEAMGRPSVVATRITGDGVIYVGGTATIVAKGELMV